MKLLNTLPAILSTRSASLKEISSALSTLMATSVAMVVASFILAFKANPSMSLHDALIVLYLLCLAWASVVTSMPAYNRFIKGQKSLLFISIIQSFCVFALGFVVMATAPSFGSTPRCNHHAVAVIFKPFPVLNAGRYTALVVLCITAFSYFFICVSDYMQSIIRLYGKLQKWYSGRKEWVPKMKIKARKIREHITAKKIRAKVGRAAERISRLFNSRGSDPQNIISDITARNISGILPSASFTEEFGNSRSQPDAKTSKREQKKEKRREHEKKKRKHGSRYIYLPKDLSKRKPSAVYDCGIFGTLLIELVIITILWALFVMNTELLIVRNRFEGGGALGESFWEFGQVLPMLLVILPLVNVIEAFKAEGLNRRIHRRKLHSKHRREEQEKKQNEARRHKREGKRKEQTEEAYEETRGSSFGGQPGLRRDNVFEQLFIPPQSPLPCRQRPLGTQDQAHISVYSIHSTNSMPDRRDMKRHTGHDSDSDSVSTYLTSSSDSFTTTTLNYSRFHKKE